jgi:hypothetical protein
MPCATTTAATATVPATLSQARRAWVTLAHAEPFEAAASACPVRHGSAGWAARWAVAAAAALAERAEAAALGRRAERWAANEAARRVEEATPQWGVVKEYGCGSFSRLYTYEVRIGAGTMTRDEASSAAKAARATDARSLAGDSFWDTYMA